MPINPVHFAHGVCKEFLRYLNSAFPLSDPDLSGRFKRLLDAPTAWDIPLAKGPYVSLSEAFAKGEPVQQMADQGKLHHVMPGLIGYPMMYRHQQEVFEAVAAGNSYSLVTGRRLLDLSSKFLLPIVEPAGSRDPFYYKIESFLVPSYYSMPEGRFRQA